MTTTQDMIAQLRALGIPDWAMARVLMTQAADTLEALQAEVANLRRKQRVTEGIAGDYKEQLDAALARLAESEAQNLMARQIILEHGEGVTGASPVEPSESVEFAKLEPVYFSQFSGCGLEEVSKDRYDEIAEDDRITYYTAAGASPQQSPLLQFCTCEDCKPMECEGCRINRERRELLPAPGEAAREYMTGYSDGREWAQAGMLRMIKELQASLAWITEYIRAAPPELEEAKKWLLAMDNAAAGASPVQPSQAQPEREMQKLFLTAGLFPDACKFDADGSPSFYTKESADKFAAGKLDVPCNGKNCGSLNGWLHSAECRAEHEAACSGQAQPSQALELSDAEIKKISSDLSLYEDYQPESCQADYLDPVKFARAIIAVINAKEKQWLKEK